MHTSHPDWQTRLQQHPERATEEQAQAFLAAGQLAHVGCILDGLPYVIPMSYHFDAAEPDALYFHGGRDSRLLQHLSTGAPISVSITLLDELVYSRTALFHSMNYRSVVAFGRCEAVEGPHKAQVLDQLIARYFEGRTAGQDYQSAPEAHLQITLLVRMQIEGLSAKMRSGGPKGPHDQKTAVPGSAGVCPAHLRGANGSGGLSV
ncbi:MAG: pyridoxamine 5'-phosphate oxidase family protein [Candidatus Sericytochromatia bacterium]